MVRQVILAICTCATLASAAEPPVADRGLPPSVFTLSYQGKLTDEGAPANGPYDLLFNVVDAGGIPLDSGVLLDNVVVNDGLFTVGVPVSADVLLPPDGTTPLGPRALRVAVRRGQSIGPFTTLSPDQPIDSTAYAVAARTLLAPIVIQGLDTTFGAELHVIEPANGTAVLGSSPGGFGALGSNIGAVAGTSVAPGSPALYGANVAPNNNTPAVFGINIISDGFGVGVRGQGGLFGVEGLVRSELELTEVIGVVGRAIAREPNIEVSRVGVSGIAFGDNAGTNIGVLGTAQSTGNSFSVGVFGQATGPNAVAAQFDGDVLVSGNVYREFTPGNPITALPVAFGTINSNGAILSGSGNFTASWDAVNTRYQISINDTPYFFSDFTTVVTTIGTSPTVATTSSVGGNLLVRIYQLNGTVVQDAFSFTVHQPTLSPAPLTAPGNAPADVARSLLETSR